MGVLAILAAALVPARAQDPPPAWPTDGCSYWENADGILFFYPSGSAEPMDPARAEQHLDLIIEGLREDRGYVLIEAHVDVVEGAGGGDLDRRRAEAIRDALIARGVPAHTIYILTLGPTRPLIPHEHGMSEVQNRRVAVRNTGRGRACVAGRRQVRLDWLRRNCVPTLRAEVTICEAMLEAITRGY